MITCQLLKLFTKTMRTALNALKIPLMVKKSILIAKISLAKLKKVHSKTQFEISRITSFRTNKSWKAITICTKLLRKHSIAG